MAEAVTAGLSDTIAALRAELAAAMREGAGETLHFALGEVEVEFQVVVTRGAGADAGIRFGVVSFGAKGSLADEATHRIKLALQPMQGDRRAVIHGEGRRQPR